MASGSAVVAILVSNPALSALLAATLAGSPSLRIRPFESEVALVTYMRLAPVDMLVGPSMVIRLSSNTQINLPSPR